MESLWTESANIKKFQHLKNDIKTDVLIVGGGLAGILCAYMLKKAQINCVLIEADRILRGVTGYTTAKITVQHGLIYNKIIKKYGVESAKMYLTAQQKALDTFSKLCSETDCDYKIQDAYIYSTNNAKNIELEADAYDRIGLDYEYCKNIPLPIKTVGALKINNQAQFNPIKFCQSFIEDITIFENTKAISLFDGGMITNKGKIFADKIIVATHFPIFNKYGGYFLKMYQHRSYVLALKNVYLNDGMYVDENLKGLSFRGYNDVLLLGGGSHRTGKKGGNWQELTEFAKKYYPNSIEVMRWATQDCMTLDGIPYIGHYSEKKTNIYVATGFNKWGMTSSMVAATILTNMITENENAYAQVFSPSRTLMHKQLAINTTESIINFLTPTVPRCPHLGCALKYNHYEHSWDCACHGSRFTKEGKVIENPATSDKTIR